jgi:hypothetical protein
MDCFNTSDLSGPDASYVEAQNSFSSLPTSDLHGPDETFESQENTIALNTSDLLDDDNVEFLQENTSTPKTVVSKIFNKDVTVTEWFHRNACNSSIYTELETELDCWPMSDSSDNEAENGIV